MTTTREGVDTETALSTDSATEAFLNRWKDAKQLSDPDGGANSRQKPSVETDAEDEENNEADENQDELEEDAEDTEADDETGDDQDEDGEDEGDEGELIEATDNAVVKITVDGEERNVPVKDLKRLYGQEASLTRKSQEVAQARKKAEDEGARYVTAASTLLQKAEERFKPYADIDWAVAQKALTTEEFIALRQESQAAYEDVKFLTADLQSTFDAAMAQRDEQMKEQAKETIRILSDPETGIPNWSPQLYDELRTFAVQAGMDEQLVNAVVDPAAIRLMHDAMMYRRAKETAKVKTKPKVRAAQRTMKSKGKSNVTSASKDQEAMKRLKTTGRTEDAVEAFMARWSTQSED